MKEYKFKINGNDYAVSIDNVDDNKAEVTVNGTHYKVDVDGIKTTPRAAKMIPQPAVPPTDSHPAVAKTAKPSTGGAVKSPLPGVILELKVKEGDEVKVGQLLLVLEAMKMENNIDSDKAGIVKSLNVGKGDSVLEGDVLLIIE